MKPEENKISATHHKRPPMQLTLPRSTIVYTNSPCEARAILETSRNLVVTESQVKYSSEELYTKLCYNNVRT